jgi:hypothetical protein
MPDRTAEEKRQAVVFAALFEYQAQRFRLGPEHPSEFFHGDVMQKLTAGVEPELNTERRRWEYWRAVLPPSWTDAQVDQYQYKHWCGAFTLYCLNRAGLALGIFWADGIGYIEPHHFQKVRRPEPGDVAYFDKNSHYAIVEAVRDTPSGAVVFDSIDGNQGKTLAAPSIKRYSSRAIESVAAFYSIESLLGAP